METIILRYGIDELPAAVELVKQQMAWSQIFTVHGTLGAGKTTLIRALLRSLGVIETITSPTFTYVNIYHLPKGGTIYHFDLYRIQSIQEFRAHGFDEYLYQPNSWCLIEWPEIIEPMLHDKVCRILLDYQDDARIITIQSSTGEHHV